MVTFMAGRNSSHLTQRSRQIFQNEREKKSSRITLTGFNGQQASCDRRRYNQPAMSAAMPPVLKLIMKTLVGILFLVAAASVATPLLRAQQPAVDPLAARIDPYVDRQRVVVMTDIANEPDDQMSMVRFLVYSNQFDVEGLIATTSTWMKNKVRPDVIQMLVGAYDQVRPQLSQHQPGFPTAGALTAVIAAGQPAYGMAAVGAGNMTAGAELILKAAEKNDRRPLWVLAWGGTNTL